MAKVSTVLMFEGQAEEAMDFYMGLFEDSEILSLARYGAEGPGVAGSVNRAVFRLGARSRNPVTRQRYPDQQAAQGRK